MTIGATLALLGTMLAIAVVPGPSDFLVVGRAAAAGFAHGLGVTLGVIAADYLFILAAVLSLGFIAEQMGSLFVIVKYVCGLYLVGLGIVTWRARNQSPGEVDGRSSSWVASVSSGFLITLGDPKAILFYAGILPAFVDMETVTWRDALIVLAAATVTIAVVKLSYAYLAGRARSLLENGRARTAMNILGGGVLAGTGVFVLLLA